MIKKANQEVTNSEILEAINDFAKGVDGRFDGVEERITGVEERLTGVEERLTGVEERLTGVEGRLTNVEATMVTKDYLDDKLADLRGDLVVLMRKEDTKLKKLVDILSQHKIISDEEKKDILSMEPFTQI